MTAWISPTWTSSDTPATARSPPKRFSRPSAASATSGMPGLAGRQRLGGPPSRQARRRAEGPLEQLPDAVREGQHDDHDDDAPDELPILPPPPEPPPQAPPKGCADERPPCP